MEQWSNGMMGLMDFLIILNHLFPLLFPKVSPSRRHYEPEASIPTFHASILVE